MRRFELDSLGHPCANQDDKTELAEKPVVGATSWKSEGLSY